MPVEVVGGDVDFVRLRHGGDLEPLPGAVPGDVDDRDVHRRALEVGTEPADAEQRLARRDGGAHTLADSGEGGRVVEIDLEPGEPEVVEGTGDLEVALGLEVEVEVETDSDVRPGPVAQRPELAPQGVDDAPIGVQLRPTGGAGKARHVQARAVCVEEEYVGLESAEAAVADFSGEPCEIV